MAKANNKSSNSITSSMNLEQLEQFIDSMNEAGVFIKADLDENDYPMYYMIVRDEEGNGYFVNRENIADEDEEPSYAWVLGDKLRKKGKRKAKK